MKILLSHNLDLDKASLSELEKLSTKAVESVFKYVFPNINPEKFEISIFLTDNSNIKSINKAYRNKDSATNVLSFPFFDNLRSGLDEVSDLINDPKVESLSLGEIIASIEKCNKEAEDQGKNYKDHFLHLIIHSMLHILGYDHIDDSDAEEMESIEIKILKQNNVENPYLLK